MPDRIAAGTPAFRRVIVALSAGGFATFALMHCVQPLLPEFARQFELSPARSSLAVSVTTACLAISMPVFGAVADSWARKSAMVFVLLTVGALAVLSAWSRTWTIFLAFRSLEGLVLAGLPIVAMAYLGEEMEASVLARAMGLYVAGTALGGMSGRLLAAGLTDLASWRVAVGAVGGVGLLCGLVVATSLPPSVHMQPRWTAPSTLARLYASHFRDPVLRKLFMEALLLLGSFVTLYNYVTFRVMAPPHALTQGRAGLLFLLLGVGTMGSAWSGGRTARWGRARLLRWNIGLMMLGLLIGMVNRLPFIVAGVAILTFGFFGTQAVASSWVTARATAGRAQASALYLLFYYVGASVAGTAGGVFWQHWRWSGVSGFILALLGAAFAVATSLGRDEASPPS